MPFWPEINIDAIIEAIASSLVLFKIRNLQMIIHYSKEQFSRKKVAKAVITLPHQRVRHQIDKSPNRG